MSAIGPDRRRTAGSGEVERLAPRAVRLRNILLRRIAIRWGLRAPSAQELSGFDDRTDLSAAVRRWETLQRQDAGTAPFSATADDAPWLERLASLRGSSIIEYVAVAFALVAIAWWVASNLIR